MLGSPKDRKRAVRAAVRARRAVRTPAARERASDLLSTHLIALVTSSGAARVTAYLPRAGEPDPSGFVRWALDRGVEVLLPISLPDHTLAWTLANSEPLAVGRHGIREPVGERLPMTAAGTADLLLIPACAVDGTGTRLGWGLGYYDRCLAALDPVPPVYALVHEDEILDDLPRDPHDVPVAGAVSPGGIHRFPTGTRYGG